MYNSKLSTWWTCLDIDEPGNKKRNADEEAHSADEGIHPVSRTHGLINYIQ
jgi:hypothetical protein